MRGCHAGDPEAFGAASLPTLRRAAEEHRWLLGRGYPATSAIAAVGNHHQLSERQRQALLRGCADPRRLDARMARKTSLADHAGATLHIDAFNLLISLEVALCGGPLFRGDDGCLRDLAGLRGSYRILPETRRAVERIDAQLRALSFAHIVWWIDAPISNSGRVRSLLLDTNPSWSTELVPNADQALLGRALVVSADAVVLDRAESWLDLASSIVASDITTAWILDLREAATIPERLNTPG